MTILPVLDHSYLVVAVEVGVAVVAAEAEAAVGAVAADPHQLPPAVHTINIENDLSKIPLCECDKME